MTQFQKTILIGEITMLMETIREQFDILNSFDGKIPMLEFDIIKENVRKLYENIYILQRLNDPFDDIIKKAPSIIDKLQTEPLWKNEQEVPVVLPVVIPPVKKTEKQEVPSEIKEESVKDDLFTSQAPSFHDKLKDAREQSLGPRFRQTNQGDIKSLININDKFLFINELFDGDYKEYTKAIDTFNTLTERRDAFDFLDSLLKNNLWNSTSAAFIKLKEIVEKKF